MPATTGSDDTLLRGQKYQIACRGFMGRTKGRLLPSWDVVKHESVNLRGTYVGHGNVPLVEVDAHAVEGLRQLLPIEVLIGPRPGSG